MQRLLIIYLSMTPILLTYICFDNGFLYVLVILHFLKYLNLFNSASSAFEMFGYHTGGSKVDPTTYASFRYFSFRHYSWNPSLSKGKCKSACMEYQMKTARLLQQATLFLKSLHYITLCHIDISYISKYNNTPLFLYPCLNQSHATCKNENITRDLDPMSLLIK